MAKGFYECLVLSFERTVRVVTHTVDETDLRLLLLLEIPQNDDNIIDLKHHEGPKGNLHFKSKRFTVSIVNDTTAADVKYHFAHVVMGETQFSNYNLYQHTFS